MLESPGSVWLFQSGTVRGGKLYCKSVVGSFSTYPVKCLYVGYRYEGDDNVKGYCVYVILAIPHFATYNLRSLSDLELKYRRIH